jgi:hypothetical protein
MCFIRKCLLVRRLCLLFLFLGSCAQDFGHHRPSEQTSKNEILYLSSDLAHAAIFSKDTAYFGPADLTFPSPAKYLETSDGVQCLSVGKSGLSIQYAVKRPLTAGENYTCLGTKFRVVRCFEECRAAIIEMDRPLNGGRPGAYQSYMYVDNCRGMLILGVVADLRNGIPLNAEWLRGEVGILAHPEYPKCRSF